MMSTHEAAKLIYEAIAAAVDKNTERAAELVTTLGTDGDAARMLGVCYAFAEAGHKALVSIFGDKAPKPDRGEFFVLHQLIPGALDDDADPRRVFSMRFLTAYCNGDRDHARNHYEALLNVHGPDVFVEGVCQLLVDAAGLCRAAIERIEATE